MLCTFYAILSIVLSVKIISLNIFFPAITIDFLSHAIIIFEQVDPKNIVQLIFSHEHIDFSLNFPLYKPVPDNIEHKKRMIQFGAVPVFRSYASTYLHFGNLLLIKIHNYVTPIIAYKQKSLYILYSLKYVPT